MHLLNKRKRINAKKIKHVNICKCANEPSMQHDINDQNDDDYYGVENYLVIGWQINNINKEKQLDALKIKVPESYYEYDGGLTGEKQIDIPVRWILSDESLRFSVGQLQSISKTARVIQDLNNRIIIYSK